MKFLRLAKRKFCSSKGSEELPLRLIMKEAFGSEFFFARFEYTDKERLPDLSAGNFVPIKAEGMASPRCFYPLFFDRKTGAFDILAKLARVEGEDKLGEFSSILANSPKNATFSAGKPGFFYRLAQSNWLEINRREGEATRLRPESLVIFAQSTFISSVFWLLESIGRNPFSAPSPSVIFQPASVLSAPLLDELFAMHSKGSLRLQILQSSAEPQKSTVENLILADETQLFLVAGSKEFSQKIEGLLESEGVDQKNVLCLS